MRAPKTFSELRLAGRGDEIEATLREHPGVQQAAVVLWKRAEADHRLVAYVVPDNGYVDRTLAGADDELRRIQKWQKTYDLTQLGKESKALQPAFNILGWNSSYTRLAIPDDQMHEWTDLTVQEILRYEPSEVLEIGCGTGLLLLRLAHRCKRYVGLDNARAVLGTLQRQMQQLGGEWTQVEILERAADHFDGFEANSFDTVILNSVSQYFPSLTYLLNVLEKAAGVVKAGGRIFLGDLRSMPLQGPFAASVELFQAPPTMSVAELRERVGKRIRLDEQLVLSPALFSGLCQRWPKISRVELVPRRGRFDNEMNRYRFNAILHVGAAPIEPFQPAWISWPLERMSLESLAKALEKQNPESLGITEVPNRRIWKDVVAFNKLQTEKAAQAVVSFEKEIQKAANNGIDPQDLWSLGETLQYDVQISWAAARTDGSYDVVFRRKSPNRPSKAVAVSWPESAVIHDDLALYANAPTKTAPRERLLQQIREYCDQRLPEAMRPSEIILLNTLPLAPDGTPDRQTLPTPDAVRV
jgi:SAM-dependent methyltransferase